MRRHRRRRQPSNRRTLMVKPRVPPAPQLELLLERWRGRGHRSWAFPSPAEEGQQVGGVTVYRMGGAVTSLPLIIRLFQQAPSPPGLTPKDLRYRVSGGDA